MQFFGGSSAAEIAPSPAAPPGTATGLVGNNGNMLYIFNRSGACLLYREWHRPLHTLDAQQDQKLMFGLLFSLRSFTAKMDPTSVDKGNLGVPLLPGQGCSFHSFRTNTYKLSLLESPSGIKKKLLPHKSYPSLIISIINPPEHHGLYSKVILITHPKIGDMREPLRYIYNIYVEYVVKNPLYIPGTPIKCELFNTNLDQYVKTLI